MTPVAMLAACGLGLLIGGSALAQPAVAPAERPGMAPVPTAPSSLGGRNFPSGQVERQVRSNDDGARAEQDRRQLEDLNALSRQLTPPGTPVPAPEAERRR